LSRDLLHARWVSSSIAGREKKVSAISLQRLSLPSFWLMEFDLVRLNCLDRGRRLIEPAERRRQSGLSRSLHRRVDFAFVGQPGHVAPLGVFLDLTKELNGFRFEARLTRVIDGDDHLDFYRNHILLGLY
jgi:hypothetical protein